MSALMTGLCLLSIIAALFIVGGALIAAKTGEREWREWLRKLQPRTQQPGSRDDMPFNQV